MDGERILFRQAVIATGASPRALRIDGAETVRVHTSEDFWELDRLPERLAIVGGGPIGCEIGQAMARLGSHVTLVQRGERLLPEEGAAGELTLDDGETVPFDVILAAVGRETVTEALGLDAAGVELGEDGGIVVDAALRTSTSRIWAAGKAAGLARFTHTAGVSGSLAAGNAVLGLRRGFVRDRTPRVTFTSPEVASIGVLPDAADPQRHRVVDWQHARADRAIADLATSGHTRIVVDRRGRILGGTIVGPRAGETMGELTLAVHAGLTTSRVVAATHPYPTCNDALWNAAIADFRTRMGRGATAGAIGVLRRLTALRMR